MNEVVIIGHGASPVGKGYGKRIDNIDTVIRMHSCEAQNPIDYGVRYDYGILPGPWYDKAAQEVKKLPEYGWLLYFLHNQKRIKRCPKHLHRIPINSDEEGIFQMLGDMDMPPTRGLCAIALAIIYLQPDVIWLVGFDSLLSGICTQYHPTHNDRIAEEYIGTSKNSRHDFNLERNKLLELSETYQIQIKDIAYAS